jgi:hypothetical protein
MAHVMTNQVFRCFLRLPDINLTAKMTLLCSVLELGMETVICLAGMRTPVHWLLIGSFSLVFGVRMAG